MRISDWSSDVCSSDLAIRLRMERPAPKDVQFQAQRGSGDPAPRRLGSARVLRRSDVHLAAAVAPEDRQHLRVQVKAVLFVVEPVHLAGLGETGCATCRERGLKYVSI